MGDGEGNNKRQAMRFLMIMPVGCFVFLTSAVYSLLKDGNLEKQA